MANIASVEPEFAIVVELDGTVITDTTQYMNIIAQHKAGDTIQVKVYRAEGLLNMTANQDAPDGEYIDLELTIDLVQTDFEEESGANGGFLYTE